MTAYSSFLVTLPTPTSGTFIPACSRGCSLAVRSFTCIGLIKAAYSCSKTKPKSFLWSRAGCNKPHVSVTPPVNGDAQKSLVLHGFRSRLLGIRFEIRKQWLLIDVTLYGIKGPLCREDGKYCYNERTFVCAPRAWNQRKVLAIHCKSTGWRRPVQKYHLPTRARMEKPGSFTSAFYDELEK